jgi:hypothetical protein
MKVVTCLCAATLICGCAGIRYEESRVENAMQRHIRELALDCYQQHEGMRMYLGGADVWNACHRWAKSRVR